MQWVSKDTIRMQHIIYGNESDGGPKAAEFQGRWKYTGHVDRHGKWHRLPHILVIPCPYI